jgi:hypothetical protein
LFCSGECGRLSVELESDPINAVETFVPAAECIRQYRSGQAQDLHSYIIENPGISILAAAAIGFLVGMAFTSDW